MLSKDRVAGRRGRLAPRGRQLLQFVNTNRVFYY
jgi:hypothetical protein